MRIHHLNCGTLCPFGRRLISGEGGLGPAEIVCHCLLIEAGDELVLIETGFGSDDARHPFRRLGVPFSVALRPKPRQEETAAAQIEKLGLDPANVRHIALTHLDLDHAGGLPDFPAAQVHVFGPERRAALAPSLRERSRYCRHHFEHGPRWVSYEDGAGGDRWFGFESIRVMEGIGAEVALIPLPGHTRGHCAIVIREGDRWLLHCGDAYFHHDQVAQPASCPPALRAFQAVMAIDNETRKQNGERLAELARGHGDEVTMFCAHDPVDLRRFEAPA